MSRYVKECASVALSHICSTPEADEKMLHSIDEQVGVCITFSLRVPFKASRVAAGNVGQRRIAVAV